MTWDHKVAICFGGLNTPENLESICVNCNQEKARWEAEIAQYMGLRSPKQERYAFKAEEES